MMGANEEATDDGTPAETITVTVGEISVSGPGNVGSEMAGVVKIIVGGDAVVLVIAGEDAEFGSLETFFVLNAMVYA